LAVNSLSRDLTVRNLVHR